MKHRIISIIVLLGVLGVVGCIISVVKDDKRPLKSVLAGVTDDGTEKIDLDDLKANTRSPEVFEYSTENGLTIILWELAAGSLRCSLIEGMAVVNSIPLEVYVNQGYSVEAMKAIVSSYGIPSNKINVVYRQCPYSSYINPNPYENNELRKLFFGDES